MEIKPDRLVQCALHRKCPMDQLYAQEYLYVDVITIGNDEIFITTFKDWKVNSVRYWTEAADADAYVKKFTKDWDVIEGFIQTSNVAETLE